MRQERVWTPSVVIIPFVVVIGYALLTAFGLLWPELSKASIVASITISLGLAMVVGIWFFERTHWWRVICFPMVGLTFLLPMIGAATLGTDLALERQADVVTGEVTDIDVVETGRDKVAERDDPESYRTTYTFVAADDGRELGTVDYRGRKGGYELEVGDEVELMVDPDGELPLKLAEEVDSTEGIIMIGIGGFLFLIVWAFGTAGPALRRAFS